MTAATVTNNIEIKIPGLELVHLTTTGTTSTYQTKKFGEIVGAWATNASDTDGVAVSWAGQTVTIVVATSGDQVYLLIAGRK